MATPTYLAKLETIREQVAARLDEITRTPKPDYSVDGETVSWTAYFQTLTQQLAELNKLIQQAGGPFAKNTIGRG